MRLANLFAVALLVGACDDTTTARPADAGNDLTPAPDVTPKTPDATAVDVTADAPADVARPLANPFAAGPYGTAVRDLAGPFTVPTQDGDWSFRDAWTGEDSYVFLTYAPRALVFSNGNDYSASLFDGSLTALLERSPRNVHYFFMWSSDEPGFMSSRDSWLGELDAMPEADRTWWRPRVHFVSTRSLSLDNWVGQMLAARARTMLPYKRYDPLQFAIDRSQRIREVGQLGRLAAGGLVMDLTFLAREPEYYNWEWDRDRRLAMERDRVTVIPLATAQTAHDTIDVDVNLPSAAELARFDTMEVDLSMECPHHRDGECGAWDYLSYLWVCDPDAPADAGVSDASADAPDAGPQYRCDREIARWITSYWRETHWVTDISGMLPQLRNGGRQHFRWNASGQFDPRSTDYVVNLSLRLSNRGRGMRPSEVVPLWTGGAWNAMYDSLHAPVRVTVPADVRKVELYALITGHGGVAPTNCAEFCDHQHHFVVNGMDHLRSFPGARSADGCAERVGEGVTPNQHGTWYFGRGGWCPGLDVAPWIVDVTSELTPGVERELRYTTTFGGRPVTAGMGNIVLSSYLVYWR
jgi:Peptide-N-glycosidase F, C terminal